MSGNPRGRPPKPKAGASVLEGILERTLTVKQNGIEREATLEEALQAKLVQSAMNGDVRAIRKVLKMIAEREAWRFARSGKAKSKPEVVLLRERDSDEAFEAMITLGISELHPDRSRPNPEAPLTGDDGPRDYGWVILEDWAIDAALSRRPGPEGGADIYERLSSHRSSRDNFTWEDLEGPPFDVPA